MGEPYRWQSDQSEAITVTVGNQKAIDDGNAETEKQQNPPSETKETGKETEAVSTENPPEEIPERITIP